MTHYLVNFVLATVGMVGLLYALYYYIRQNPQLASAIKPSVRGGKQLRVCSVLSLEPRKQLYVVGYGEQRFMIATTMDKTELLATLNTDPLSDVAGEVEADSMPPDFTAIGPGSGLMERFRYSLKSVLLNRFTQTKGK
jgi:flagellar biogenesis protein FliO